MSNNNLHIIEKLTVEVQTNSNKLAYKIKDEKDAFFMEELMELLASIFDEYLPEHGQMVQLETIKIEFNASSKDFEFDVKRQVLEQLSEILPRRVLEDASKIILQNVPNSNGKSDALLHFLKTGNFPWWFTAPANTSAMDALIYDCLDMPVFIKGFREQLKQPLFKKRSVLQLSDGFLLVLFNKILKEKYNKNIVLSKNIDGNLKFSKNTVLRSNFWSFVATISSGYSKGEIANNWRHFTTTIPTDLKISKPLQKQLDLLAIKALGESTIASEKITLLSKQFTTKVTKQGTAEQKHARDNNLEEATFKQNEASSEAQSSLDKIKDKNLLETAKIKTKSELLKGNKPNKEQPQKELQSRPESMAGDDLSNNESITTSKQDQNIRSKEALAKAKSQLKKSESTENTRAKKEKAKTAKDQRLKEKDHDIYKESTKEDSQTVPSSDQNFETKQDESQSVESLKSDPTQKINKTQDNRNNQGKEDLSLTAADATLSQPQTTAEPLLFNENNTKKESHFYATHCGLVLLHPFLVSFFKNCDLLDSKKQLKAPALAANLLHYVATGNTAAYEYQLRFERFLCNIPAGLPMDRHIELSQDLIKKADELLAAILGHLPQLKSQAAALLQNEFLSREGKVILEGENPRIIIERKTQDMLLDSKPWSTSIVKMPWLPNLLFVDW